MNRQVGEYVPSLQNVHHPVANHVMSCHTGHILSIYPNFPRGHGPFIRQHSRDRFQGSGFPGSVRTQQSYTLPPVKMQIDAMKHLNHPLITRLELTDLDRKSTRLNSSHVAISYAVFCL